MPQIVNIAIISTHAPAGGATIIAECEEQGIQFLLTPLREGRRHDQTFELASSNFYSRPCGRGDGCCRASLPRSVTFLLTPLREGRPRAIGSTWRSRQFLLTPLREGRPVEARHFLAVDLHFYSRPCGRGDLLRRGLGGGYGKNFYSRPCGRGDSNFPQVRHEVLRQIAER